MSRLRSPWTILAVLVLVSTRANAAQDSVPGPDGTPITRENYPSELVSRPLVLPPGMFSFEADLDQYLADAYPSASFEVAYGVVPRLLIGLQGATEGAQSLPDIQAFANYLITPNVALNVWVVYNFQDGSDFNLSYVDTGFGIPLKYKFPHVPVAIGGLGNLLAIHISHWPSRTLQLSSGLAPPFDISTNLTAANGVLTELRLPAWVEYSPLRLLSFEVGVQGIVIMSNDITPKTGATVVADTSHTGDLLVYGEIIVTPRPVDVGVAVREWIYFESPLEHTTDFDLFASVRF